MNQGFKIVAAFNLWLLSGALALGLIGPATAQQVPVLRSAIVALADDSELRRDFETGLMEKARRENYNVITTFDIEPDAANLDSRRFLRALSDRGIQAVLVVRPAAIGPGSSLETVRNEVPEELFADMRDFASAVSDSGSDNLIAIVHMAIYTLRDRDTNLISSGAVWLDEDVEDQEQGVDRLQDLIVGNVNAARPAIRSYLGLPPLN